MSKKRHALTWPTTFVAQVSAALEPRCITFNEWAHVLIRKAARDEFGINAVEPVKMPEPELDHMPDTQLPPPVGDGPPMAKLTAEQQLDNLIATDVGQAAIHEEPARNVTRVNPIAELEQEDAAERARELLEQAKLDAAQAVEPAPASVPEREPSTDSVAELDNMLADLDSNAAGDPF